MKNVKINLDNINSTLILPEVRKEMFLASKQQFGLSEIQNKFGNTTLINIEKNRQIISKIIACNPENIFFTTGETETRNKIINNFISKYKIKTIISNYDFNNNSFIQINNSIEYIVLNSKSDFEFDLEKFNEILKKKENSLVILTHANYINGHLIPLKKITDLCKKYNSYICIDFSLSINYIKLKLNNLNIDIGIFFSSKFHGPLGNSFIYIKSNIPNNNNINQNYHLEFIKETENILGIIGMTKAIASMQFNMIRNVQKIKKIRNNFIEKLIKNNIDFKINCNLNKNLPSILNLSFPKKINDDLFNNKLELNNVIASNSLENSFRFSFGIFNTLKEINSIDYKIFK